MSDEALRLKRTNQCWRDMRQRCLNPNSHRYYTHGGRGIDICERWGSFNNFLKDMGLKPDGYTLERIDNESGYSPENCKWATPAEQARNRRTNVFITFKDETKTIMDWALTVGVSFQSMKKRLRRWNIEKALTTPRDESAVRSKAYNNNNKA